MEYSSTGVSEDWSSGVLERWSIGRCKAQGARQEREEFNHESTKERRLEWWNNGMMGRRIMEEWNTGVME
jgi:hypothetical protein